MNYYDPYNSRDKILRIVRNIIIAAVVIMLLLPIFNCFFGLSFEDETNNGSKYESPKQSSLSSPSITSDPHLFIPSESKTQPSPETIPETIPEPAPEIEITSYTWTECYFKFGTNYWGDVCVQCFAVLENTGNTNLYLTSAIFDIEDSNGDLVEVLDSVGVYPLVIAPGEKAVCYEVADVDLNDSEEEYSIIPSISARKATVPLIRYQTFDTILSENSDGEIMVTGRVKNTSVETDSIAYATIILYDANQKPIYLTSVTLPRTLAPGEQTSFKTSFDDDYFGVDLEDMVSYDIIAYPFQWQYQ